MDRKTEDFKNAHYTPELIRQYEDPEYARRAEEYERRERNKVYGRRRKGCSQPDDMYGYDKKPKKHKRHLAALLWLYEPVVLRTIVDAGVAHKFLMGTDFPILDSSRYERMFAASGIGEDH